MSRQEILFSVDVEDWYQVENLKDVLPRSSWSMHEPRVEDNTQRLLELLDVSEARGTFFVLGYMARKHPELVKKIHRTGHEIASHGYGHELLYKMTTEQIRDDVLQTKEMLEDLTGTEVVGYRAPAFSITDEAIDILAQCGYKYDSSMFSFGLHDRYGSLKTPPRAHSDGLMRFENGLLEVPLSMLPFMGKRIPWAGGGYFRLMPYKLFRAGAMRVLASDGAFAFYVHPWEIDPGQPRIKGLRLSHRFRHYVNLDRTYSKLEMLSGDFSLKPYREIITD